MLGRYCVRPERYTLTSAHDGGWRRVTVLGFGLDRSGDPPLIQLSLTWTGAAYRWTGSLIQLCGC